MCDGMGVRGHSRWPAAVRAGHVLGTGGRDGPEQTLLSQRSRCWFGRIYLEIPCKTNLGDCAALFSCFFGGKDILKGNFRVG